MQSTEVPGAIGMVALSRGEAWGWLWCNKAQACNYQLLLEDSRPSAAVWASRWALEHQRTLHRGCLLLQGMTLATKFTDWRIFWVGVFLWPPLMGAVTEPLACVFGGLAYLKWQTGRLSKRSPPGLSDLSLWTCCCCSRIESTWNCNSNFNSIKVSTHLFFQERDTGWWFQEWRVALWGLGLLRLHCLIAVPMAVGVGWHWMENEISRTRSSSINLADISGDVYPPWNRSTPPGALPGCGSTDGEKGYWCYCQLI